jgi:hypothetical protein
MSSPQNWRGTSETIAWRVRVGAAARVASRAVVENGAQCSEPWLPRGFSHKRDSTQPLIERPLITVAEVATLLRESNGRLLGGADF